MKMKVTGFSLHKTRWFWGLIVAFIVAVMFRLLGYQVVYGQGMLPTIPQLAVVRVKHITPDNPITANDKGRVVIFRIHGFLKIPGYSIGRIQKVLANGYRISGDNFDKSIDEEVPEKQIVARVALALHR